MTIYSSRTPRDLNHDPEPYRYSIWRNTDGNSAGYDFDAVFAHDPRERFDHVQHNQPNPILIEFRASFEDDADLDGWVEAMLTALTDPGDWGLPNSVYDGTDEEVAHAYAVITRLAGLSADSASP
jgi:hypothetical protein